MTATKPLVILKETILAGESKTINMEIAKLHTMNKLKIPIIVERSKLDGPTVLFTACLHGDEINGTEIVRQLIIQKIMGMVRSKEIDVIFTNFVLWDSSTLRYFSYVQDLKLFLV